MQTTSTGMYTRALQFPSGLHLQHPSEIRQPELPNGHRAWHCKLMLAKTSIAGVAYLRHRKVPRTLHQYTSYGVYQINSLTGRFRSWGKILFKIPQRGSPDLTFLPTF